MLAIHFGHRTKIHRRFRQIGGSLTIRIRIPAGKNIPRYQTCILNGHDGIILRRVLVRQVYAEVTVVMVADILVFICQNKLYSAVLFGSIGIDTRPTGLIGYRLRTAMHRHGRTDDIHTPAINIRTRICTTECRSGTSSRLNRVSCPLR